MKYCLSARQPDSVLKKADEIKVLWQDIQIINNFIELYQDKTIILEIPKEIQIEDINWNILVTYNEIFENFYLCIQRLNEEIVNVCKDYKLKYYWYYPATTYFELNTLKENGVSQIFLGMPLTFDLKQVKEKVGDIILRTVPNYSYDSYIQRNNGLKGFYIRPEDVDYYNQWIDVCEFRLLGQDYLTKEESLLHVYKDNKMWPGNLNLLITNFHLDVDNRGFPNTFAEIRANCRQRCESGGNCHFCETSILFSTKLQERANRNKKDKN